MCFDLVSYFFLKLSKIDISENLRFLAMHWGALVACSTGECVAGES